MSASKTVSKSATKAIKAAPTSTANLLAPVSSPITASPAAPVKPAAVMVAAGHVNGAPENAPLFMVGGTAYEGALRPHHAKQQTSGNVNRLPAGSVTITAKGEQLKPGGVAYNAMAWQAIQNAITKGPCSAAELAAAVGNGGASHITYRINGGWLAVSK